MELLPWFRALHIAATVLIGGGFAFDILILRRCADAVRAAAVTGEIDRRLKRQCAWGLAIGLISWLGWLAAVAISMSGLLASQAITFDVISTVLERTTFGLVWVIRLVLLVVLGLLLFTGATKSKTRKAACALSAGALVASLAWTGHALGTNRVHVWVDAIHLLAATAWLGMLPLLLLVTQRAVSQPMMWRDLGVSCAKCFYLPGVVAVLLLAGSGVANTSWMVDSIGDLANTKYGRVLSLKLALFALMLLLAAANRFVIIPRVESSDDARASLRSLRSSVLVELLLGAAILAIVAWLGVTAPVAYEHIMHHMHDM